MATIHGISRVDLAIYVCARRDATGLTPDLPISRWWGEP